MGKKTGVGCLSACVILVIGGGYTGYTFLHAALSGPPAPRALRADAASDTPPKAAEALGLARGFLADWSAGHYTTAAGRTDAPATAGRALRGFHDGLALNSVRFTGLAAGGADRAYPGGRRVTFTVTARVAGGVWSYPDTLDVLRSDNGIKAVHWNQAVLKPGLQDGQTLSAGRIAPSDSDVPVVARDGRTRLTDGRDPSLADIITTIAAHAPASGGHDGSGVSVLGADGTPVHTLKVFRAPRAPAVRTTIDAALQKAADAAVLDPHVKNLPSSVIALDWHTGDILAVAFNSPNGNEAFTAEKAPGSTMKIITAAALFDQAGLTPNSPAPCASSVRAQSETFTNEQGVRPEPGATIAEAFRVSCNTSFITDGFDDLVHHGTDASALHNEAYGVFGFGSWSIGGGVFTEDPSVPADPPPADQAPQFIGQGLVTASPLVMASVAATVRDGAFHQPIIVPGTRQTPARRPISVRTAGYLQEMMRTVALSGTAAPRTADLVHVGAKTGTAEEQDHTNGWLTAYNDHITVASLVDLGGSGVDTAGWVVRDVLKADQ